VEDNVKPVAKRTKPQPVTSAPAAPAAPAKKPTNAKNRFAATVLAEEETAQRNLSLKKQKNRSQKEVALAKIQVDADYRLMKAKAKAADKKVKKAGQMSLIRLRIEQEHEIRRRNSARRRHPLWLQM
jgi:PP-loop superfamily ATP-utilizing enzyme